MKKSITVFLTLGMLLLSASAHAVLIDFEAGLSAGDIVTGSTISGATFTVSNQGTTGGLPRELMIFNSNCTQGVNCSGGDDDLSTLDTINAGNILIISTNNNSANPNDSASGGLISIAFDTDVTSITGVTVDIGDSDSGPNFFEAFLNGSSVEVMMLDQMQGNNNIQSRTFTGLFDEIRLSLAGSGALASIEFTPVPLPAALPLFIAGLLGLLGMRKRTAA